VIAIPTQVRQLQPGWHDCVENAAGGFYDPPRTLGRGLHLVPTAIVDAVVTPPPAVPEQNIPQGPSPTSQHRPDAPSHSEVASGSDALSAPIPGGEGHGPPAHPPPGSTTTIILEPSPSVPNPPTLQTPRPPSITLPPKPGDASKSVIEVIVTIITPLPPAADNANLNQPSQPLPGKSTSHPIAMTPVLGVIVGSQTLLPGAAISVGGSTRTLKDGTTTVVDNVELSLDAHGGYIVVDGTSTILVRPPAITIGSSTLTAQAIANGVVVGTHTIMPDAAVVMDGKTLSLDSSQATLWVDGIPMAISTPTPFVVKLGTETFTLQHGPGGGVIIDSQTLRPGSHVEISGTTVSLQSDAATLWVNGSPVPLPQISPRRKPISITLGSDTYTLEFTASGMLIGNYTLLSGRPITIAGTELALSSDTLTLFINGSALPLYPTPTPQPIPLAHTTLVPDSLTRFTFGTQTLSARGPAVTWNGTTWSIAVESGKTVLIVGNAGASVEAVSANKMTSVLPSASEGAKGGNARATSLKKGAAKRAWEGRRVCVFVLIGVFLG